MVDNTSDVLIYLDHNVLDKITKGQLEAIFKRLSPSKSKIIPVYSDESLQEITKSKGYEDKLLSLLKEIDAVYLQLEQVDFRYTGKAAFINIDPIDAYSQYIGNKKSMPDLGYGLTGMLQKFYGGLNDKTYSEVLTLGIGELLEELDHSVTDLQADENLSKENRIVAQTALAQLRDVLPQIYGDMGKRLDSDTKSATIVDKVENYFSAGPKILNNIKGPNVVKQIWDLVKQRIPDKAIALDMFFGLTPDLYGYADKRELSLVEKVNALYHQLNFLGYHRDSKMQNRNKFHASFSDRTHAGYAIFCHYIMSMDEKLIKKTAAAYEYLGVFTRTIHLKLQ
jgi:hypothetical protein